MQLLEVTTYRVSVYSVLQSIFNSLTSDDNLLPERSMLGAFTYSTLFLLSMNVFG